MKKKLLGLLLGLLLVAMPCYAAELVTEGRDNGYGRNNEYCWGTST